MKVRYPLAAARRLDAAAQRVAEIEELRSDLEGLAGQALALRRTVFRLVGAVESAVIASTRRTWTRNGFHGTKTPCADSTSNDEGDHDARPPVTPTPTRAPSGG